MATGGKQALTKLTKKATAKGLWFYSHLLTHWWSPDKLQAIYTDRAFRQDADHFILRDPTERLREFDETIAALRAERRCFKRRINTWRKKYRATVTRTRPDKDDVVVKYVTRRSLQQAGNTT